MSNKAQIDDEEDENFKKIKVDEYSMLSFNRIYDSITDKEKEIELIAQIGDTITLMPTVS